MTQDVNADQGTDTLDVNTGASAIAGLLSDDLDIIEKVEGGEGADDSEDSKAESEELEAVEDYDDRDDAEDGVDDEDADPDDESEDDVDDEADEATDDSDSPPTHKVKMDGEEFEVTLEEALAGYQRTQIWTKRMQAVAQARNTLSEQMQATAARGQEYLDKLDLVEKALTGSASEPNWEQLKAQDPKKYADARIAWEDRKTQLQQLQTEQQKVREEVQASLEDQRRRVLALEAERLEAAIPEWAADSAAKREGQQKIVQFAETTYGFTPDDLGSIADHRVILLLRDAMAYNELQTKGSKAKDAAREKRRKSPTLQPGNPQNAKKKAKSRKNNSARKKLAQSGRIDDAAAVLFDMLSD